MKIDSQQMMQLRVLAGRNPLLCWKVMTTIPWPDQKEYTSIKKHCKLHTNHVAFRCMLSRNVCCTLNYMASVSRSMSLHACDECRSWIRVQPDIKPSVWCVKHNCLMFGTAISTGQCDLALHGMKTEIG